MDITDEQFEIAFDLWLQDYRIIAWEGLTSDEILCLCKFHRENFLKELGQYTKDLINKGDNQMKRDVFTGKYPCEELAEIAYDAYGETTNFKNSLGEPMLEWSELPLKIKQAWCEAAIAIREKVGSPNAAFAPAMGAG